MMKSVVVLLFVCASLVLAADPPMPSLSEVFSSVLDITIKDGSKTGTGKGMWASDQPGNKGLEKYEFDDNSFDIFNLQRFDLGDSYSLDMENNKTECHEHKITGTMPKVWSWLSEAKYAGNQNSANLWKATIGYATLTLGVSEKDANTPLFLIKNSRDERVTTYTFQTWNVSTPVDSLFDVPTKCSNRTSMLSQHSKRCISGDTAVSRAKVWVAAHVPYNQGGTYQGYREDCSGYVSMCWESSEPGHTTYTMNQIAHEISKDDLQAGDCLLYAAEHVVLFGGWLNSEKTQYQAYEETQPGEGTVTRPTPYPYWYSQSMFLPYRYDGLC